MNTQKHSAIKMPSYEAIFGQRPSGGVFPGIDKSIQPYEDDLLDVLEHTHALADGKSLLTSVLT